MRILIHGAGGHMGRILCGMAEEGRCGAELIAQVSPELRDDPDAGIYTGLDGYKGDADCVIDFSHHSATAELLDYCIRRGFPVVIATTGQTEEERKAISLAAEKIPVLRAALLNHIPGEKSENREAGGTKTAYGKDCVIEEPIRINGREYSITAVSMGNPHAVVFLGASGTGLDTLEIEKTGPCFERHPAFPDRVNTEFIEVIDEQTLRMRVWERGSGETLACGTGACAAAVAAILTGRVPGRTVTVQLRGGDLLIEWDAETGHVYMTGPAVTVFTGEWP